MRVLGILTLKVWYDDAADLTEPKEQLENLVKHAANVGLLSGDSPMTVDTYDVTVDVQEVK